MLEVDRRLIGMLTDHDLRLVILERCLQGEPGQLAHTLASLRVNEIIAWEHSLTGVCHAAGCRCKHFMPEIRLPRPLAVRAPALLADQGTKVTS